MVQLKINFKKEFSLKILFKKIIELAKIPLSKRPPLYEKVAVKSCHFNKTFLKMLRPFLGSQVTKNPIFFQIQILLKEPILQLSNHILCSNYNNSFIKITGL